MKFAMIMTAMAMMSAPSNTFNSWFSPETATSCLEMAVNNEYTPCLDYNGDGVLSTVDAIAINKRYHLNCENGNSMTFGESEVMRVVEENLNPSDYSDYFYYEIDFIENESCREYEIEVNDTINIHVYCEVNDSIFQFTACINPFEESITVID